MQRLVEKILAVRKQKEDGKRRRRRRRRRREREGKREGRHRRSKIIKMKRPKLLLPLARPDVLLLTFRGSL